MEAIFLHWPVFFYVMSIVNMTRKFRSKYLSSQVKVSSYTEQLRVVVLTCVNGNAFKPFPFCVPDQCGREQELLGCL